MLILQSRLTKKFRTKEEAVKYQERKKKQGFVAMLQAHSYRGFIVPVYKER